MARRAKRAEWLRRAWLEYHAGRIPLGDVRRVLESLRDRRERA